MRYIILASTWYAITALLLIVAIASGATPYAFAFAVTISGLALAATVVAGLCIRFLGGEE